jgi:hypothetical protein
MYNEKYTYLLQSDPQRMQFYAKLLEKFLEPYLTYLGKLLYKENVVMIILPKSSSRRSV